MKMKITLAALLAFNLSAAAFAAKPAPPQAPDELPGCSIGAVGEFTCTIDNGNVYRWKDVGCSITCNPGEEPVCHQAGCQTDNQGRNTGWSTPASCTCQRS